MIPFPFRRVPGILVGLIGLVAVARAASVEILAGAGAAGPAGQVVLKNPFGLLRAPDGAVWWCEFDGNVVRRLPRSGRIQTVVGTGVAGNAGDGGPARKAQLNQPHEIRLDRDESLFIADMKNHSIRKVDRKSGLISTVAGTGRPGYAGDGGPAIQAALNQPHSLALDADGNLFISDTGNHVIRRVDRATGVIRTFAGTGKAGKTPDEAPLEGTPLNGPRTLSFAPDGGLWLATREGNQLFRIDVASGRIRRVAGTGESGPAGDGGPAMAARLTGPKGVAIEIGTDGQVSGVVLADTESHTLRRVLVGSGKIERVLGTGTSGSTFSADPLQCQLARPHGVWADRDGALLVGDSENGRVLRVK